MREVTAGFRRRQAETSQCIQIPGVQLAALCGLDDEALTLPLYIDPNGVHAVENTTNAPLVGGTLHGIGESTLDWLDTRICGTGIMLFRSDIASL